ncbi:hypothetical protein B0H17DRAFT_1018721 [Mycena rosella]|uniref:MYND-type domain-containing protein n=1 Tax=Mycena rosella TaxID=1033263 RepID=A0AAD7G8I7_MYCRO|nr:hypothetical protein B0H17DRAFT_1018721 [Mycena rosella]
MPPEPLPSHLRDRIMDDNFWGKLEALAKMGEKIMPELAAASRKSGQSGTLDQRIEDRCEFARVGVKLAAITGSPLLSPGPAPRRNPPIPNGMMYCMNNIEKIVCRDYGPGKKPEFSKLAYLLRRTRHLLRIFYDCAVDGHAHPDLIFCDWEKMFDVGLALHRVGLCLRLDPPRLRAAMAGGGKELEAFLLDDELDIGEFRKAAFIVEQRVAADVEAEDADRMAAGKINSAAQKDLAAHILSWFYGDISVAFIMNETSSSDANEKRWAHKAMKRLVLWSTSTTYHSTLGDSLTDAMRPIYWSLPVLTKFGLAGGLGALFGDWVNSACKEMCEDVLKKLPDAAWQKQTPTSLRTVTRALQLKLNQETSEIAITPIFINACFNMYKLYDLAPFRKAAKCEAHHDPVVFYYVAHRIKRDGLDMCIQQDWRRLLKDYVNMPRSVEQRYMWGNQTISGRWDCLEFFGCDADGCPEQTALEELRAKRVRGVRDPDIEERLERWGSKPRACAACAHTSYCSPTCQRTHWQTHKPECLKKRKVAKRS